MSQHEEPARQHEAALTQHRWFLSRLEWFDQLLDTRPVPPQQGRPLTNDQAARLYRHLRAEYEPQPDGR